MRCDTCGAEVGVADRFCVGCGSSLSATASGGASPPAQPTGKGFFASLFDTGFASFVTPKLIKVLYTLIIVVLALVWLGFVITGFSASAAIGLLAVVGGAIVFLLYLILARVTLELFMAVFRIADDVQGLRRQHSGA